MRLGVVLVGAVAATLAPMLVTLLIVVASSIWSLGTSGRLPTSLGSLVYVGLIGALAMVVNYALGIPVALKIEEAIRDARGRLASYGLAGSAAGGLVGVWFAGATMPALLFAGFGLVAALGGATGVGWARGKPATIAYRRGWTGTLMLTFAALAGWLSTGLVVIPLLAAGLVGSMALVLSAAFRPGSRAGTGQAPNAS